MQRMNTYSNFAKETPTIKVSILLAFTCIELYFVPVNQQNDKWEKKDNAVLLDTVQKTCTVGFKRPKNKGFE